MRRRRPGALSYSGGVERKVIVVILGALAVLWWAVHRQEKRSAAEARLWAEATATAQPATD